MKLPENNYVCDMETSTALVGPLTLQGAVDFIVMQPDQKLYFNGSRYYLAKIGKYPRTKAGQAALDADLAASPFNVEPIANEPGVFVRNSGVLHRRFRRIGRVVEVLPLGDLRVEWECSGYVTRVTPDEVNPLRMMVIDPGGLYQDDWHPLSEYSEERDLEQEAFDNSLRGPNSSFMKQD